MARLNYIEKEKFERLFGLGSGYVLDFTNRQFQEFIYENAGIDVYRKYQGLSKAKILRNIIKDYNDIVVGKILLGLMQYMQEFNLIKDEDKELFRECLKIGNKLIGKKMTPTPPPENNKKEKNDKKSLDFKGFLDELRNLSSYTEDYQARGFAFEKYLCKLFSASGLDPRSSFRVKGEQIDGSFILSDEVYLLEAKWTNKNISKGELVIFNEKVSSKSGFTRGLFISFSNFSDDAVSTLSNGRIVNVVLLTVQELAIAMSRGVDLRTLLRFKVRALAEEGNCNKSALSLYPN